MKLAVRIKSWWGKGDKPLHLHYGELGERAAKKQLERQEKTPDGSDRGLVPEVVVQQN